MEVKINQQREQFLKLSLENTEYLSKVLSVQALIDTGCNVDLSISSKLAKHLGLEVKPIKGAVSKFANGAVEQSQIARLGVGFFADLEHLDFEAVAFVSNKKNWLEVEISNKLLSRFCVNNKLVMEFDYYENLVRFKDRKIVK